MIQLNIDIYIVSLVLTIVVEGVAAVTWYLLFKKKLAILTLILITLFANLITHPWAYYFYTYRHINIYVVELSAVIIEMLIYQSLLKLPLKTALVLSATLNFSSYMLGKVVFNLLFQ